MPNLADVFTPEGFGMVALTNAIQKLPHAPTTIADLGVFREQGITGTMVAIEDTQGVLALVPTTKRGGPGTVLKPEKRTVLATTVPHIQVDDVVLADDVLNVRAFGSQDAQAGIEQLILQKLASMKRSVDVTNEYLRLQALHGVIAYPATSVDPSLSLFTLFGESEVTVDMDVDTDGTDQMAKCAELRDAMESALGGTPYTGIHVLCGRTFFRLLVAHPTIHALYLHQQALVALAPVTEVKPNRRRFVFEGITFEEYYGYVGTQAFINAAQGRAFPIGADVLHTYYAPSDAIEGGAGTVGQSMYARQYAAVDGKSVNLEVQCNALHLCVRPKCLIKLT